MLGLTLLRLLPQRLVRFVVPRLRYLDLLRAIQSAHIEAGLPRPLDSLRILQAGCGNGLLLFPLALQGAVVSGVDADASQVAVAQNFARALGLDSTVARFQVATLQSLPFPERSADVVIVGQALAEADELLAFKEVARVLRPGGLLAMTLFAAERRGSWLRSLLRPRRGAPPPQAPQRRFDATDVRQKLELMGFEVVDTGSYLTGIGALAFELLSTLPLFDRRTLPGQLLYALGSLFSYLPAIFSDAMGATEDRAGYGLRVFAVRRSDTSGPPRSNGNGHGLSLKYTAPMEHPTHAVAGRVRQ
jgi:SAM-dependent methyltransferase